MPEEYLTVRVEKILHETEQAFLLQFNNGDTAWCPKSQVENDDEYSRGDTDVEMNIASWFVKKYDMEDAV